MNITQDPSQWRCRNQRKLYTGTKNYNKIEMSLGSASFSQMKTDSIRKELYLHESFEVLVLEGQRGKN